MQMQNGQIKTEAIKIREQLGVGTETILSPRKPEPHIIEENILEVLTHTGVFLPEDCKKIIHENTPDEWDVASVNAEHGKATPAVRDEIRRTLNSWVQPSAENMWLFDKMLALIMAANQRFQFEVDMFEAIQLARYEPGMHYDWHLDIGPGIMGNRKLSVTVQLSDPDSYEGGDLVLDNGIGSEPYVAPREIGSVTVFPSFMKHKVTPVTSGVRHSLVVWASGQFRFR
jgi:PKHD-type hydroxylase